MRAYYDFSLNKMRCERLKFKMELIEMRKAVGYIDAMNEKEQMTAFYLLGKIENITCELFSDYKELECIECYSAKVRYHIFSTVMAVSMDPIAHSSMRSEVLRRTFTSDRMLDFYNLSSLYENLESLLDGVPYDYVSGKTGCGGMDTNVV